MTEWQRGFAQSAIISGGVTTFVLFGGPLVLIVAALLIGWSAGRFSRNREAQELKNTHVATVQLCAPAAARKDVTLDTRLSELSEKE